MLAAHSLLPRRTAIRFAAASVTTNGAQPVLASVATTTAAHTIYKSTKELLHKLKYSAKGLSVGSGADARSLSSGG